MVKIPFHLLNIFGERRMGGCPVVICETTKRPDPAVAQRLAYQFCAPETGFLETRSQSWTAYTPQLALPYSTAVALGASSIAAQIAIGAPTIGYKKNDLWWVQTPAGHARSAQVDNLALAAALGLNPADLSGPLLWVDSDFTQLVVPLRARQHVLQVAPRLDLLMSALGNPHQLLQIALWSNDGEVLTLRAFTADPFHLQEDFGAGSAAAAIGHWFIANGNTPPFSFRIEQGHTIHRRISPLSVLYLDVDAQRRVAIGGRVWQLGGGELEVDGI
jgi:trans-2,3-dihydro-3-hydroxyanthranilate isomerase